MHLSPQEVHDVSQMSRRAFFESHGMKWEEVEHIINLYKIYQYSIGVQDTIHHICSRKELGRDVANNRVHLPRKRHTAHHDYFDNKLPHVQPVFNLWENSRAINERVTHQVDDLIGDAVASGRFYKRDVI